MKIKLGTAFYLLKDFICHNNEQIKVSESTTETQLYFALGADNCCQVCREREDTLKDNRR